MTICEIERQVKILRERPLRIVCQTPKGQVRSMSVRECVETGSSFLHIAADDLD